MDRIDLPTAINQPPDANAQMEMRNRKLAPKHFAAANIQRRKQIVDDAATLLKLTRELKTEIDAITGDMPVAEIVRRAEAIERLARSVREKMKLVAGAT